MSTTTTTFNLTVITDDSIAKNHLGAAEMLNRSWCGVQLLIEGDTRFGGRYAGMVWKTVTTEDGKPNFELMSCGACKRSAAWKVAGSTGEAVYTVAPKGTRARREPVSADEPARADAAELADLAAQAAAAAAENGDTGKPSRRKRKTTPPAANEQTEAEQRDAAAPGPVRKRRKSAADRAAEQLAADQAARAELLAAAEARAAEHIDGSRIVETDPETGLPRIRPDVVAKVDGIVADQLAANEALINEVIDGGTEGGQ